MAAHEPETLDLGEEVVKDVGEKEDEKVSRRRVSSKRKSSKISAAVELDAKADETDKVTASGRHLRFALGVALLVIWAVDLFSLGFRGGSTPFIDWWDMIGTVAYLRGRHEQFSLRRKANQKNLLWMGYIVLDAFILYEIAGKTCRTIMRKQPVLPTLMGFSDFIVYGLLPVHFFPGDYLFDLANNNSIHVLIISAFWGLTKVRSLYGQMSEAVLVHHYSFPAAFMLCMLSCEIASVYSRIEMNVTRFPLKDCVRALPGGITKWLFTRTFASSIFISLFMYATIRLSHIPVVWIVPNVLGFAACFYRYANGLLERTISEHLRLDKDSIREFDAAALQNFVDNFDAKNIQDSLKRVPDKVVQESIKLTQSLIVSLEKLGEDSRVDLQELLTRLEDISQEMEQQKRRTSTSSRKSKEKSE